MAISKNDLKFYFTHVEPLQEQADPANSVGGYISTTEVLAGTTLTSLFALSQTTAFVTSTESLTGKAWILIDDEIVGINSIAEEDRVGTKARTLYNMNPTIHVSGSKVYGIGQIDVFGNEFSRERKQYRCLVLKNTSETQTAHNISVYLKYASNNPSTTVRFAIERPLSNYYEGAATSGTSLSITDTGIPEFYEDNAFRDAIVEIMDGDNEGETRTVTSYDQDTSTLMLDTAFANRITAGTTFVIYPSPAQRLINGIATPQTDTDGISEWSSVTDSTVAVSAALRTSYDNYEDLGPGDVLYIWLERQLGDKVPVFQDNRVVLAIRYET